MALSCVVCKRPVTGEYFLAGTQVVCSGCKIRVESSRPESAPLPQSLLMATLFGFGAAIVAAALWAGVVFFLHLQLGIAAIAVGYLVGAAVRKGARGNSGAIFQGIAMVLTVCAVVWSLLPFVVEGAQRSGQAF